LDDRKRAWLEFFNCKEQLFINELVILKLFTEMKKHEPTELMPIYHELALKNIQYKKRSAYAKVAKSMKDLKEVCLLAGKEQEWC